MDAEEDEIPVSEFRFDNDRVRFRLGGELVDIRLVEGDIQAQQGPISAATVFVRDGKRLSLAEAGVRVPRRGRVEGRKGWASLHVDRQRVRGFLSLDGELFSLEPRGNEGVWAQRVREWSDEIGDDAFQCGTEHADAASQGVEESSVEESDGSTEARFAVQGCSLIDTVLVAGPRLVQDAGSVSESEQLRVDLISATHEVYMENFSRGFNVTELVTYSDDAPFDESKVAKEFIKDFRFWKQSNAPEAGIAYFLQSGTNDGAAYLGFACQKAMGVGVSWGDRLSTGVPAMVHEMGHLFNAEHDEQGRHYMYPTVYSSTDGFSDKSISSIESFFGSSDASCFVSSNQCEDQFGGDAPNDSGSNGDCVDVDSQVCRDFASYGFCAPNHRMRTWMDENCCPSWCS